MSNRALQSLAHFALRTRPTSPKLPWDPQAFCAIFMWNQLWLQSHAHCANPIFQKSFESLFFFKILMWNRACATVLCTFCRQLLQIEARNCGNRDPTSATTEATLPRKTEGFAPESLSKPEFTRSRPVTLPKYLMMMWLTWWCGLHGDGENAAHDNRP